MSKKEFSRGRELDGRKGVLRERVTTTNRVFAYLVEKTFNAWSWKPPTPSRPVGRGHVDVGDDGPTFFWEEGFDHVSDEPLDGIYVSQQAVARYLGLDTAVVSKAKRDLMDVRFDGNRVIDSVRPLPGKRTEFIAIDSSGFLELLVDVFGRFFFPLEGRDRRQFVRFAVYCFTPDRLYYKQDDGLYYALPGEMLSCMEDIYAGAVRRTLDREYGEMMDEIASRVVDTIYDSAVSAEGYGGAAGREKELSVLPLIKKCLAYDDIVDRLEDAMSTDEERAILRSMGVDPEGLPEEFDRGRMAAMEHVLRRAFPSFTLREVRGR